MRARLRVLGAAVLGAVGLPGVGWAGDVVAGAPTGRSVTVYRARSAQTGPLSLNYLEGFALVTETRSVTLPAGESRLRFPGVADGIEPASALLTGLPEGVLEKNRDAQVLSPAALVAANLGRELILVRQLPHGRVVRTRGRLRSDNDGVVFESSEGVEALRCSGLPETFEFSGTGDLSSLPTLSVRVRSSRPISVQVTLSYLTQGFDWAATYTALLAPDAKTLDLGAWVTLANSNSVSFPEARTAVVAGRVRHSASSRPSSGETRLIANCWPLGRTSDIPEPEEPPPPPKERGLMMLMAPAPTALPPPAPGRAVKPKAMVAQLEQLGDLKLYRVPQPATVSARQMKQVRLMDREGVRVALLHMVELTAGEEEELTANRVLRSRNDKAHGLGLPLPAGRVSTYAQEGQTPLLLAQAGLRDIAENEEFELQAGQAEDVQVRSINERVLPMENVRNVPLLPGVELRTGGQGQLSRIEISNATGHALSFEARLDVPEDVQMVRSTVAPFLRDGRQVMRVSVPARGRITIRYQTATPIARVVRPR